MTSKKTPDVSAALRELLLQRAAGKLSREEFERREAVLHAQLLAANGGDPATSASAPDRKRRLKILLIGLPILVVAVGAIAFLAWRGLANSPGGTAAEPAAAAAAGAAQPDVAALNRNLAQLSGEVVKHPMNGEVWAELGRVYAELGRHPEASDAFAKAAAILPPSASLLADWADSYVVAHDRKWDATSRGFIKRALAADPKHLKTLSLAASDAYDQGDFKVAIAYWKRMAEAAPGDASVRQYVAANIADANAVMGGTAPPSATAAAEAQSTGSPAASAVAAISGRVSISDKLKSGASPNDAVFVFARSVEGMGPPLAVKRFTVGDLPADFRLDDDSAMVPGRSLSTAASVVVVARVSKSGNPVAQPGDLESPPQQLLVGAKDVKLEISSIH